MYNITWIIKLGYSLGSIDFNLVQIDNLLKRVLYIEIFLDEIRQIGETYNIDDRPGTIGDLEIWGRYRVNITAKSQVMDVQQSIVEDVTTMSAGEVNHLIRRVFEINHLITSFIMKSSVDNLSS